MWLCLVVKLKSDAVKNKIAQEPEMLGHESRLIGSGQTGDDNIYYCGQKSVRRNGVALIVNKRVQNVVLGCNLKNETVISVHIQGKSFNITVIQDYAQPLMLKKLRMNSFMMTLQDLLELTPHKDVLFIIGLE